MYDFCLSKHINKNTKKMLSSTHIEMALSSSILKGRGIKIQNITKELMWNDIAQWEITD